MTPPPQTPFSLSQCWPPTTTAIPPSRCTHNLSHKLPHNGSECRGTIEARGSANNAKRVKGKGGELCVWGGQVQMTSIESGWRTCLVIAPLLPTRSVVEHLPPPLHPSVTPLLRPPCPLLYPLFILELGGDFPMLPPSLRCPPSVSSTTSPTHPSPHFTQE